MGGGIRKSEFDLGSGAPLVLLSGLSLPLKVALQWFLVWYVLRVACLMCAVLCGDSYRLKVHANHSICPPVRRQIALKADMKYVNQLLALLAILACVCVRVSAEPLDDQNTGPYMIRENFHYSNKTSITWGRNGLHSMSNVITLSSACATYDNSKNNCSSSWQYDWNKLWGKARCGYAHDHHQDSDRFVWRRCSDSTCDAYDGTAKIQIAAYSYDNGVKPYPANPDLLKPFQTTISPEVPFLYTLAMSDDGASTFLLSDHVGVLLESVVVNHATLCEENYYEGTLQGFYFGGQCTAPEEMNVFYSGAALQA